MVRGKFLMLELACDVLHLCQGFLRLDGKLVGVHIFTSNSFDTEEEKRRWSV
jgi:hypothetical protein